MQILHNLTRSLEEFSYSHEKQEPNHVAIQKMQKSSSVAGVSYNRQNVIDYSVNNESKPTKHLCGMQLQIHCVQFDSNASQLSIHVCAKNTPQTEHAL